MPIVADQIVEYVPDLTRYAFSLVGPAHRADAEDLVQDCIERALERSDRFEPGTNLRAWLFTLMRNIFFSKKRHEAVQRRFAVQASHDRTVSQPASQNVHLLLSETVDQLQALTGKEREMLVELAVRETAQQSVAKRLGHSVGTVKSRLSRTRAKLRARMDGVSGHDISALSS